MALGVRIFAFEVEKVGENREVGGCRFANMNHFCISEFCSLTQFLWNGNFGNMKKHLFIAFEKVRIRMFLLGYISLGSPIKERILLIQRKLLLQVIYNY